MIYAESRFRDQTSHAGAQGLMQITPDTAQDIAQQSGGTAFERRRPRHAAGQHLLRRLVPALPARAATAATRCSRSRPTTRGEGNVDRWVDNAQQRERDLTISEIPFAETRHYVRAVHDAHVEYRRSYAAELGI